MPVFITEGNNTASTAGSRALHAYMLGEGFDATYKEVAADHDGMIPLVLPDVFAFFNARSKTVPVAPRGISAPRNGHAATFAAETLRIAFPPRRGPEDVEIVVFDASGKEAARRLLPAASGEAVVNGLALPHGLYHVRVRSASGTGHARFAAMP